MNIQKILKRIHQTTNHDLHAVMEKRFKNSISHSPLLRLKFEYS